MQFYTFSACGKDAVLCAAETADRPLIVLNSYNADITPLLSALREEGVGDFNLLSISGLDWNHDLAPWDYRALSETDPPFTGGADAYLELLLTGLLPKAAGFIRGTASRTGIAGYSLAGLFALYSLYRCEAFDCAASMSGSLWFPGFRDYVSVHRMPKKPDRIYLSLGDKESRTRNPVLKTIMKETESIAAFYREAGLDVIWELNKGNHFTDPEGRTAKGILSILERCGPKCDE